MGERADLPLSENFGDAGSVGVMPVQPRLASRGVGRLKREEHRNMVGTCQGEGGGLPKVESPKQVGVREIEVDGARPMRGGEGEASIYAGDIKKGEA